MDSDLRILRFQSPALPSDFDSLIGEHLENHLDFFCSEDNQSPQNPSTDCEELLTGQCSVPVEHVEIQPEADSPLAPFDSPATPFSYDNSPVSIDESTSPVSSTIDTTDFLVYRLAQLRVLSTSSFDRRTAAYIASNLGKMSSAAALGQPVDQGIEPLVWKLVHQKMESGVQESPAPFATVVSQPTQQSPKRMSPVKRRSDTSPCAKRAKVETVPQFTSQPQYATSFVHPAATTTTTPTGFLTNEVSPLLATSSGFGISPMALGGFACHPVLMAQAPMYAYHHYGLAAQPAYAYY